MKLIKLLLVLVSFSLISGGTYASIKELTGTVVPILKTTLNVGGNGPYRGTIDEVARQGSIIFPDVYDLDGNIVKAGTTLVHLRSKFWEGKILACQGTIDGLKGKLIDIEASYLRAKKLIKDKSISQEEYQQREGLYYNTVYQLKAAENDLVQFKVALASHTIPTPYPAKVDKVFIPGGLCATIPAVVTISELSPIGVKVEIPREEALKINTSTPVTIFPAGNKEPIGVIHGQGRLTDKGYEFAVYNEALIGSTIEINNKTIPTVRNCHDVYPIIDNGKISSLCVPCFAIFKDKNGSYVWLGENQKNLIPDQGIAKSFPVKKVYITPGKAEQQMAGCILYNILHESNILSPYDIVIADPPRNLKDGDIVSFIQTKFLLMPGDKLKVVIGNKKGVK